MAGARSYYIWLAVVLALLLMGLSTAVWADSYQYDALGRLIGVAYTDGSSITYQYDAAGNRTVLTQIAAP